MNCEKSQARKGKKALAGRIKFGIRGPSLKLELEKLYRI
jgi:hypothetical protein